MRQLTNLYCGVLVDVDEVANEEIAVLIDLSLHTGRNPSPLVLAEHEEHVEVVLQRYLSYSSLSLSPSLSFMPYI